MTDGIIKNTGNSRYIKSVPNFKTLFPTYDDYAEAMSAVNSDGVPIDLNGINPNGWSTQGTPLNKAALLKDATAALYGLVSTAVPDDILAVLGPYTQYWWKRTQVVKGASGTQTLAKFTSSDSAPSKIPYADSYAVIGGKITLIKSRYAVISSTHQPSSFDNTLVGKYIIPKGSTDVYYSSGNITVTGTSPNTTFKFSGYKVSAGNPSYVKSTNSTAYPVNSESGGYWYEAQGRPLDNAVELKTYYGSYVGTGTCGASYKNVLTFPFVPKLVIVQKRGIIFGSYNSQIGFIDCFIWAANGGECYSQTMFNYSKNGSTYSGFLPLYFDLSGTSLSYSLNQSYDGDTEFTKAQLNEAKEIYYVTAFG